MRRALWRRAALRAAVLIALVLAPPLLALASGWGPRGVVAAATGLLAAAGGWWRRRPPFLEWVAAEAAPGDPTRAARLAHTLDACDDARRTGRDRPHLALAEAEAAESLLLAPLLRGAGPAAPSRRVLATALSAGLLAALLSVPWGGNRVPTPGPPPVDPPSTPSWTTSPAAQSAPEGASRQGPTGGLDAGDRPGGPPGLGGALPPRLVAPRLEGAGGGVVTVDLAPAEGPGPLRGDVEPAAAGPGGAARHRVPEWAPGVGLAGGAGSTRAVASGPGNEARAWAPTAWRDPPGGGEGSEAPPGALPRIDGPDRLRVEALLGGR